MKLTDHQGGICENLRRAAAFDDATAVNPADVALATANDWNRLVNGGAVGRAADRRRVFLTHDGRTDLGRWSNV